ncbi:hypothetical protein LTR50_005603 [Elasticomyces elasticus]|nr:hypothetical protein LTR50_005603 [Elasticomyces elasticus]
MSGTHQIPPNAARSPLDRPPVLGAGSGQPPSFKTVPNRNKTQRWVEAKSYTYDGDDWGDYDTYDEYAGYDEPPPEPPTNQRLPRTNSFDAGDERRTFSSEPRLQQATEDVPESQTRNTTLDSSGNVSQTVPTLSDYQRGRDFSPTAMPQPLQTRSVQEVVQSQERNLGGNLPLRKRSVPQESSPTVVSQPAEEPIRASSFDTGSNAARPIQLVRPADIYKRMQSEKEKERRSMDSGRPSPDSSSGQAKHDAATWVDGPRARTSIESASRVTARKPSLDPVTEVSTEQTGIYHDVGSVTEQKVDGQFSGFTVDNPILARAIGAKLVSQPNTDAQDSGSSIASRQMSTNATSTSPTLPFVNSVASAFGDHSWGSSGTTKDTSSANTHMYQNSPGLQNAPDISLAPQPDGTNLQHQPSLGFRSVVHQAFDRRDETKSMPPTPISTQGSQSQTDPGVSRSNTNSTSDISPIMSRIPSNATSHDKTEVAEVRGANVLPVVEEGSLPSSPQSRPASSVTPPGHYQVARKPSPSHSRDVSAESYPRSFQPGYRRDLNTPSPANSPARSPVVEASRQPSAPLIAELSTQDELPTSSVGLQHSSVTGPSSSQPADYATRESDMADMVNSNPENVVPGVAEAAKDSRTLFLDTHRATSPGVTKPIPRSVTPIAERESPAKGRVRDLAGKFNEIEDTSRRNSTVSVSSKSSWSSWGRGEDNMSPKRSRTFGSQDATTNKSDTDSPPESNSALQDEMTERPSIVTGTSFRPRLPGEWVSFAPTPGTVTPLRGHSPNGLERDRNTNPEASYNTEPASPATPIAKPPRLDEDQELTPTTARRPLSEKAPEQTESSAVAAVKAAGDALGAALMASMGLGSTSKHPEETTASESAKDKGTTSSPATRKAAPSVGDVYLRPLQLDRAASSVASSAPPTPPPKDTLSVSGPTRTSGYFPPPVVSNARTSDSSAEPVEHTKEQRPPMLPQLSTDTSVQDLESDRLRKEIVRSLTPNRASSSESERDVPAQEALDAPTNMDRVQHEQPPMGAYYCRAIAITGPSGPKAELPHESPNHASGTRTVGSASPTVQPRLLDQRFSWENRPALTINMTPERPGLHVVNPDDSVPQASPDEEMSRTPNTNLLGKGPNSDVKTSTPTAGQHLDLATSPKVVQGHSGPVSPVLVPSSSISETSKLGPSDGPPSPIERTGELPNASLTPNIPRTSLNSAQSPVVKPPQSPTDDKNAHLPPFRQILAIRSAPDRITTYNTTRERFAAQDTGLADWISATLAASPEHAQLSAQRPTISTTGIRGSIRHRHSPSIMKFTKSFARDGSADSPSQPPPPFQQYVDLAPDSPQTPTQPNQPLARTPSTIGASGRNTGQQMQAKGKDLLHTAGVLGGKASVGAKGLFAKGKSRFRTSSGNEKVD